MRPGRKLNGQTEKCINDEDEGKGSRSKHRIGFKRWGNYSTFHNTVSTPFSTIFYYLLTTEEKWVASS